MQFQKGPCQAKPDAGITSAGCAAAHTFVKAASMFPCKQCNPEAAQCDLTVKLSQSAAYHFIDLGGVVLLNVPQDAHVIVPHKVDGHTLAPKAPTAPNAVDVQLTIIGQVVVDHQGYLAPTMAIVIASARGLSLA